MSIDLYDGNNVMRRVTEKHGMPSMVPMGFRQRFEYTMAKPPATQIWVWDGKDHNEMRKSILPTYKANREPAAEDIFAQIRLWRDALRHTHAIQICAHGWEADDVIYSLVKRFNQRGLRPTVHSNDIDYGQLEGLCHLNGVNTKGCPGRWLPLRKAMVGKASDNMHGIPGFGSKRFDAMAEWYPQIERAIEQSNPAGFLELPFTPAVAAWLAVQENVDLLNAMLRVARFVDVPEDEIVGGMTQGMPNYMAAHELMNRFFL